MMRDPRPKPRGRTISRNSSVEEEQTGFAYALNVLSRRDHSEAELRRKLERKGIGADAAEAVIARLRRLGYLDDRRVAFRLAETAAASGRMVGYRLRQELGRKGIPPGIAEEALAKIAAIHDERRTIAELLARKFTAFDPAATDVKEKRRIVGWFQRRGFSLPAILESLRIPEDH